MHGHALTFAITIAGFVVALLALVVQVLAYRRGK